MKHLVLAIVAELLASCKPQYHRQQYKNAAAGNFWNTRKIEDVDAYYRPYVERLRKRLDTLGLKGKRTVVAYIGGHEIYLYEDIGSYRLIDLEYIWLQRGNDFDFSILPDTLPRRPVSMLDGRIRYHYVYSDTLEMFRRFFDTFPQEPQVYDYEPKGSYLRTGYYALVDVDGTLLLNATNDTYFVSKARYGYQEMNDNGVTGLFYDIERPLWLRMGCPGSVSTAIRYCKARVAQ